MKTEIQRCSEGERAPSNLFGSQRPSDPKVGAYTTLPQLMHQLERLVDGACVLGVELSPSKINAIKEVVILEEDLVDKRAELRPFGNGSDNM